LIPYWIRVSVPLPQGSINELSAGYEHDLNNRLSIFAVPLLNIPLKGVGDGQIKLFSMVLLMGEKFSF
jgi:hypothetical protein